MSGYTAHMELASGVVRVYAPGLTYVDGDAYEWSALAVALDRQTVELRGVTSAPSIEQARAVQACLLAAGFTRLRVERFKHGRQWSRMHTRDESRACTMRRAPCSCPTCGGTGWGPEGGDGLRQVCQACNGTGTRHKESGE